MAEVVVVVLASPLTQLVNLLVNLLVNYVVLPRLLVIQLVTLHSLSTNDDLQSLA